MGEPIQPRLHEWRLEAREYLRHEQRRGRRHAFDALVPERTALVVVDMVRFFVSEMEYCRGIVPNINRLATTLRRAGGTVAWVLPANGDPTPRDVEFFGRTVAEAYRRSGGEGPLRDRLWPELDVADGDLLVEKDAPSAFFPGSPPCPSCSSSVRSTRSSSPGR